ncbi:conjugal transfer protein [Streptomyces sp. NPDC058695]|uniref:conjugal transfer protein n=1 Tax=Streptomyces sp. NPDC058695 TaxID=3346604 RepID=UPI0036610BD3
MSASLRRDRRGPTKDQPSASSPPRARSLPVRRAAVMRTAVWLAVAAGPLALVSSCARPDTAVRTTPAPVTRTAELRTPSVTTAGYAELFLGLWLRGGSEDGPTADELHAMAPSVPMPTWGEKNPAVERLATVRTARQAQDAWSVTLAVTFKEPARDRSDRTAAAPSVRYFALPVVAKDAGTTPAFAVPAAPMEVAAPSVIAESATPYGREVPDASALASTVSEFLTAYLGAEGGAERYLAPGITLPALAESSFASVQIDELRAVQATDGKPGQDGSVVRVQAQVTATDAAGGQWPLSYALAFTARAGRWEVTALQSGLEDKAGKTKTASSHTDSALKSTSTTMQTAASSQGNDAVWEITR